MRSMAAAALIVCLALSSAFAKLETFMVSNEGWTNAEMTYMEPGRLFLKAEGKDPLSGQARIIVGISVDAGETWVIHRLPWVHGLTDTSIHCLGYAELYWLHGHSRITAANSSRIPVYYSDGSQAWAESWISGAVANTSQRCVNGMQIGHRDTRLMWAGGYEHDAAGMHGRVWRGSSSGLQWESVPLPGGIKPVQVWLGGRAPDYTAWGWTHENLIRMSFDGTVNVFPGFTKVAHTQNIYDICAPTNTTVHAVWRGGPVNHGRGLFYLSTSYDRGHNWSHSSIGSGEVGPIFIHHSDENFGAMAIGTGEPVTRPGYYLHATPDGWGTTCESAYLAGQMVRGIATLKDSSTGVVCALTTQADPRYLSCVRWTPEMTAGTNRPPTVPTVKLRPRHPKASERVTCTASGSTDPDGDQVTYKFQWYKDGVLQQGRTQSTLASKYTSAGERWKCVVTPTDGKADGPTGEAQVKIDP